MPRLLHSHPLPQQALFGSEGCRQRCSPFLGASFVDYSMKFPWRQAVSRPLQRALCHPSLAGFLHHQPCHKHSALRGRSKDDRGWRTGDTTLTSTWHLSYGQRCMWAGKAWLEQVIVLCLALPLAQKWGLRPWWHARGTMHKGASHKSGIQEFLKPLCILNLMVLTLLCLIQSWPGSFV